MSKLLVGAYALVVIVLLCIFALEEGRISGSRCAVPCSDAVPCSAVSSELNMTRAELYNPKNKLIRSYLKGRLDYLETVEQVYCK